MTLFYKAKLIGADEPPVWRVLALPNTATFHDLHRSIQDAFDWKDYHLFEFRDSLEVCRTRNEWRVQDHESMDWDVEFPFYPENSRTTRLIDNKLLLTHFFYEYDFGDSWKLDITLDRFDRTRLKTAACLAKRGAPPPEDCGSLSGFARVRRFFALEQAGLPPDKELMDYGSYREWLGLKDDETWDEEVGICKKSEVDSVRARWRKEAAAYVRRLKACAL